MFLILPQEYILYPTYTKQLKAKTFLMRFLNHYVESSTFSCLLLFLSFKTSGYVTTCLKYVI